MDQRRRSQAVGVGGVAIALAAIVAVGFDTRAEERGVCVDRSSQNRVSDDECENGNGGAYGWYYIPAGRSAPAEGEKVSGQGSFTARSDGNVTRGGVASDGGTVTRGGFFSGKGDSFGG